MAGEIVIRRVRNGWEVVPYGPRDMGIPNSDVLVFNSMGGAYAREDNQPTDETLLGWIEKNMALENKP